MRPTARVNHARWRWWLPAGFVIGGLVVACATVPITGRSQLSLVPDDIVIGAANEQFPRIMMALRQKNLLLSPSESPQAATVLERVSRVSERVLEAAGIRQRHAWEIVVVKARERNALVMPNGKIIIFTGMLPVAKDDAGLAAIIGHEVAHVVARHQAERMSQVLLTQLIGAAVDIAVALKDPRYRPAVSAALGLGAQLGVLLPFSLHESEADRLGLVFMAKAGYDPSEAISLWERMEAGGGSGPWEFLNTHPSPATRRAQIRAWLPEARVYFADRGRLVPPELAEIQRSRDEDARRVALAPARLGELAGPSVPEGDPRWRPANPRTAWLIGTWVGNSAEGSVIEFEFTDDEPTPKWKMVRRRSSGGYVEASGEVAGLTGSWVELQGKDSVGQFVAFSFAKIGPQLAGYDFDSAAVPVRVSVKKVR